MGFRSTRLWEEAFGERAEHEALRKARSRLASALDIFHERAELLAEEVTRSLPQLTDHSIKHLDALWELADMLRGDTPLNPAETFVLGGSILLHDLGNAIAAYENGLSSLLGSDWNDLVHAEYLSTQGRRATPAELSTPPDPIFSNVLLARLRQVHAKQAESLAVNGFKVRDDPGARTYLLENEDLRSHLGRLIGRIAHSHHWDIERVRHELQHTSGTSPTLPADWTIDALKIALLLRIADICHIDSRRSPTLRMAWRELNDTSREHWTFQNLILRPEVKSEELVYSSARPFNPNERAAWWRAYETLLMIDRELRNADRTLRSERDFRFAARAVADVATPETIAKRLETSNWLPIDAKVHVSDVPALVQRLGGAQLYAHPEAAVRELIANAADAIRARRVVDKRPRDWGTILVTLAQSEGGWRLSVADDGIGMSENILRGPLLDFGTSLWRSRLAATEHPGLLSSDFEPTGHFGIGFFSAFMLGRTVRVTTRRYDHGRNEVRILQFDGLTNHRPILMAGTADDLDADTNTRIDITLDDDPLARDGILPSAHDEADSDLARRFANLIALIAPALDATIHTTLIPASSKKHSTISVRASDWATIPFDDLLARISRSSWWAPHPKDSIIPEIRVTRGERLLARVRPRPSWRQATSAVVIGGLSTLSSWHPHTWHPSDRRAFVDDRKFEGIAFADSPNIDRSAGRYIAHESECREAVRRNFHQLDGIKANWHTCRGIAQLLLNSGLRPQHLKCFLLQGESVSAQAVRSHLKQVHPGTTIAVMTGDVFYVSWAEDEEGELDIDDALERWPELASELIIGDWGHGDLLNVTARREFLGTEVVDGLSCPNSLSAFLKEMASEEWGSASIQLEIDNDHYFELATDEEVYVSGPALLLTRKS